MTYNTEDLRIASITDVIPPAQLHDEFPVSETAARTVHETRSAIHDILHGTDDPVVPIDEVEAIRDAYAGHANSEIVVHPGATHNFSMPHKDGYHAEAAKASRDAVLRCFRSM